MGKVNVAKWILCGLLMVSLGGNVAYGAEVPGDVVGKPYEMAVSTLFERGIITGDENGFFNPEQNLTRAQACILVVKSMDPPVDEVAGTATQPPVGSGFPDMSGYSWAEGYIGYAVRNGVTKGYPDGSFKPGNKVTSSELATMVLRAAGYSDEALPGSWPENYKDKAEELDLYESLPGENEMPDYASKWVAAQMNYNALDIIDAAKGKESEIVFGSPKNSPEQEGWIYQFAGRFDSSLSSFGGIPVDRRTEVLTFATRAEYNEAMEWSSKASDYRIQSLYAYKNVITPAWIRMENGRITEMILPEDVGFTGQAYSVVNGLSQGILSLTAGQKIHWAYAEEAKTITSSREAAEGAVYRLSCGDGKVKAVALQKDLLDGFVSITDYQINGPIQVKMGDRNPWMSISTTPTIYVMDPSLGNTYRVGKLSDIKAGYSVKLFDISDDGLEQADILIIKQ